MKNQRGWIPIINLVNKAKKGDDKAFLKLFQRYEEEIYRMAYVYVKNQDDALDVVQEAAYRSFKKIETLKNPQYFKTWLLRIVINCAIDLVNKNKKVVELKPELEELMGSDEKDIPLSLSLQEIMYTLHEEEKSVVLLRFYYDHTFKEIAEVLEIPLGTAKSTLYRALEKLRKQAKEAGLHE